MLNPYQTLTVEWTGGEMARQGMGKEDIQTFMESQGYETIPPVEKSTSDLFFAMRNV